MSTLDSNREAKLFFSIIFQNKEEAQKTIADINSQWGEVDFQSEVLPFHHTNYYEKEFGANLSRIFIGLAEPIDRNQLVEIKQWSDVYEKDCLKNGNRVVNLDPGYISLEQVILATGKNFTHRVYLGKGVFADLTLMYEKGSYHKLAWTFPDYAEDSIINMFNVLRNKLLEKNKGTNND